jgi:phosphoribosylformimino-5-aminoimidazole carboxamide ribotide isomerase
VEIFPAIDISGGKVVRLRQGDFNEMTVYSESPADTAEGFFDEGAQNLHMVDLDGAKQGLTENFGAIAGAVVRSGLYTQVGGGIRDMERLERYLSAGVSRVILGTSAVQDPGFLKRALAKHGEQIAVGVDARDGKVRVEGWLRETELNSVEFCEQLIDYGVGCIIYTDISRDGMMGGPNFDIYARLAEMVGVSVIASGGIASVEDVKALRRARVHGVIIGSAFYKGTLTIKEALEAAR